MKILDGKNLSEKILNNIKEEIAKKRLRLKLAVILVGDNRVSEIYISQKEEACQRVGIDFEPFRFPEETDALKLKDEIKKIAQTPDVSGIVIQLPLPEKFNVREILNLIPLEKDVDALSDSSDKEKSPLAKGVSWLLKEYGIEVEGRNVVIVGAGRLVGKPLALWFRKRGSIVSVVDESTEDISSFTREADIIVSGAGKPGLIKGDMIKEGAVVIDAGSSTEGGKLLGDVDFDSVSLKAGYITPVPGGVGPMTVACLLENLVDK